MKLTANQARNLTQRSSINSIYNEITNAAIKGFKSIDVYSMTKKNKKELLKSGFKVKSSLINVNGGVRIFSIRW